MILGHFANVINRFDRPVGMDRLKQVVLQQIARRERGEFVVVTNFERMQHTLGEYAVAEGDIALAAAKEGKP